MLSIEEVENQVISEFEIYDDWLDRYNYLIEMGKSLPVIDPKHKNDNNLYTWLFQGRGCMLNTKMQIYLPLIVMLSFAG